MDNNIIEALNKLRTYSLQCKGYNGDDMYEQQGLYGDYVRIEDIAEALGLKFSPYEGFSKQ